MNLHITDQNLTASLINIQRDDVLTIIDKQLLYCNEKLRMYDITHSDAYRCSFTVKDLNWFKELHFFLAKIPVKAEALLKHLIRVKPNEILSRLELLPVNSDHIINTVRAVCLSFKPLSGSKEIESLAIACRVISRCRICEYGHYTNEQFGASLSFHGCLANSRVQSEIIANCTEFSRRVSDDN
jgi:hypothetical protein